MGFHERYIKLQNSYLKWKNRKLYRKDAKELEFLKAMVKCGVGCNMNKCVEYISHSKSERFQDLFVLAMVDFKSEGFFVEFGALDGFSISNSYLLEKKFGWNGILAEPARSCHSDLMKCRDVFIDFDCVWHTSNKKINFWELSSLALSGTPLGYKKLQNKRPKAIKKQKEYQVSTVSLDDLLQRYNAPAKVDYLSIDTEGTELEIIRSFNFKNYQFSVITIEHNFTSDRDEQFNILTSNGYRRILESYSGIDDWYILK